MIEIVARWRSRMIGVRVIVADHAEPAASCIIIGALGLLGRYQVASLTGLLTFVLSRMDFGENVGIALACPQKEAAALVRVSSLAVLPYLIQVF